MILNQSPIIAVPFMRQFTTLAIITVLTRPNQITNIIPPAALEWDNVVKVCHLAFTFFGKWINEFFVAIVAFAFLGLKQNTGFGGGVNAFSFTLHGFSAAGLGVNYLWVCFSVFFIVFLAFLLSKRMCMSFFRQIRLQIIEPSQSSLFSYFFSINPIEFSPTCLRLFWVGVSLVCCPLRRAFLAISSDIVSFALVSSEFCYGFSRVTFGAIFNGGIHSNHLLLAPNEGCSQSVGVTDFRPVGLDYNKHYSRLEAY